jgi:hypothetical protein
MTPPGTRSGRLVIAVGFASAIAIVPVAAALSSEHTPSGSERSVAGCIPFTEICFPDPPNPNPVENPAAGPPPAEVIAPGDSIEPQITNRSNSENPAPAPPTTEAPMPITRFVIPSG